MLPVHIWNSTELVNLSQYPEHFYEHAGGRGSNFLKPQIHDRHSRLSYEHVGEFAKDCISKRGEAAIHIFILSHFDLLSGPSNDHLGAVCETIIQVSQLSNRTVVLFVALFPLHQMAGDTLASAVKSKERAVLAIEKYPLQAKWILPQIIPPIVLSLSSPAKLDFQALFYRELTKAVNGVVLRHSNPQLRPTPVLNRPQAPFKDQPPSSSGVT